MNVRNAAFPPTLAGYLNADQSANNQLLIPFRPPAGSNFSPTLFVDITVEKTTIGRIPIPSYLFLFHTYRVLC